VKRFRPTDAFVDESIRGSRYLMSCVLVEAAKMPAIRSDLRNLVLRTGRLHFNNELPARRRLILATIAASPLSAFTVVCHRRHGVTEFEARNLCLADIVGKLQDRGVGRLTIESRQDDRDDVRALRKARHPTPPLVWDHIAGLTEPMLWVADGVAWAVGSGGPSRAILKPILSGVVDLRP
jgi:hypothetical protein